jgi:hypothetical protein
MAIFAIASITPVTGFSGIGAIKPDPQEQWCFQ